MSCTSDSLSTPQNQVKRTLSYDPSTPLFGSSIQDGSRAKKMQRMDPERLNDILEDFDAEVEERIHKIRTNAKLSADRLKRDLNIQLTGMNTAIRKMTVKEFRKKYSEDIDRVMQAESNELLHNKNQIMTKISLIHTSTATMTTPRKQANPIPLHHQVHQTYNFKTPSKTPKKIVYQTPSAQATAPTSTRIRKMATSIKSDTESANKENATSPNVKGQPLTKAFALLQNGNINFNSPTTKMKFTQDPSALQELQKFNERLQSILSAVNGTTTIN